MHKNSIGVDIGGTKIRAGRVVENTGVVSASTRIPTPKKGGTKAILNAIAEAITTVWDDSVQAIGLGVAGHVDFAGGIFLHGPNLPPAFKNIPLAEHVSSIFKVKARIDNDAHCFTVGEAAYGAGKGHDLVVGLTFGTGIGGGIVMGGRIIRGRNNSAGEFGHATLATGEKLRCSCGRYGHFEALAAGRAMSARYLSATGLEVDALGIEERAKQGDRAAADVITMASEAISEGLASIVHSLNPDIIVLGGGLLRLKSLWSGVQKRTKAEIVFQGPRTTPIVKASLGDDANILGATLLTHLP